MARMGRTVRRDRLELLESAVSMARTGSKDGLAPTAGMARLAPWDRAALLDTMASVAALA